MSIMIFAIHALICTYIQYPSQRPWETRRLPAALPNHQERQPTHHQGHLWGDDDDDDDDDIYAGDDDDGDDVDDNVVVGDDEDDDFENCQPTYPQGHLWGDDHWWYDDEEQLWQRELGARIRWNFMIMT